MPKLKRILFPVDFSIRCAQTAPLVEAWATQFGAPLTLLHSVVFPPSRIHAYSKKLYAEVRRGLREDARKGMDKFIRENFASFPIQRVIETGDPGRVIVEYAEKEKVDLIMMPTHGYGPFRRFLIGSVAGKVLHDARCPVWTSAHTTEPPPAELRHQRFLCAVDPTSDAPGLIQWADWLARQYGADLNLVHVIPSVDDPAQDPQAQEVRRYLTFLAERNLIAFMEQGGISGEVLIKFGNIAHTLAQTVKEQEADLLIIGRGRIQKKLGRLRSHSLAIICDSPCPVVSL